MKSFIILNPSAGTSFTEKGIKRLHNLINKEGFIGELFISEHKDHIRDSAEPSRNDPDQDTHDQGGQAARQSENRCIADRVKQLGQDILAPVIHAQEVFTRWRGNGIIGHVPGIKRRKGRTCR